ncbi:MAG: cadherin-like domain-containing protein [Rhodocyclaceae bacterium]|nr:cadherin-like domain-containing protein [Rhodocyclaceae bacterium]
MQDAGEVGKAGGGGRALPVSVNHAGTLVDTQVTDANGNYNFSGLMPGDYIVKFIAADGSVLSTANVGDDAFDSDAGADGFTGCYTLTSGENNTTVDAGFYETGSIGDRVWVDANGNGVQDAGEVGKAGVTVELYTCVDEMPGTLVDTKVTDANGNYNFSGLVPGDYIVKFIAADGSVLSTANVGDDAFDSDAGADGFTGCYTLSSGETIDTVDAGFWEAASLGDRVWLDANDNGVQDAGEVGKAGVTVTLSGAGADGLFGTADDVSESMVTDANGNYLFDNLVAGQQYKVTVEQPTGFQFTTANQGGNEALDSDVDASGVSNVVTLSSGENYLDLDAGLVTCKVDLGDKVWLDENKNGLQDDGEPGVAGVTVTLIGAGADGVFGTSDDTTRTDTTDANGNYLFENVEHGTYKVRLDVPDSYKLTTANVGSDDSKDSDFVAKIVKCTENLIVNGSFEENSTGMFSSIKGWTGIGDKIEVGTASSYGVSGQSGSNVVELDANKTCTDNTGFYQAVNTTAGQTYELSVDVAARNCTSDSTNTVEVYWAGEKIATIDPTSTKLTTYTFTVEGTGGADRLEFREQKGDDDSLGGIIDNVRLVTCDTVVESGAIVIDSCEDNLTIDAGLVEGMQCIQTCEDHAVSFTVDVPSGQTILSFTQTANGTVTDNGDGTFTYTPTTNYFGSDTFTYTLGTTTTVTKTSDVYIRNGSFEEYSLGDNCSTSNIPGWNSGSYYYNATWDPSSYYAGSVSDGQNIVKVSSYGISQTLSETFEKDVSYQLKVDVANIKNYSSDNGSAIIKVYAGSTLVASIKGSDIGSITEGGYKTVTLDFEGKGFSDSVYGSCLKIVLDSSCYSYYDNVRMTKTETVSSVVAGETIEVCLDVHSANDAPTGADKTVCLDAGASYVVKVADFGYADVDGNAFKAVLIESVVAAGSLKLDGVDVTAGQTISVADIEAGKLTYTASGSTDASFSFKVQDDGGTDSCGGSDIDLHAHTITFDAADPNGRIGDRVWVDKDCDGVQDSGEYGLAGVTVKLLDTAGHVLETTTTNSNGNYLFDHLSAGQYVVQVVTPNGYNITKQDVGNYDCDSDANPTTGKTDVITLGKDQWLDTVDIGLCASKACIGSRVWEDSNHNSIQDLGEKGIGGVRVTLYGWNGSCAYTVGTTTTDSNGNYEFSNLNEGYYYVAFDKTNVWHNSYWGGWYNMSNWNWGYKDVGSDDTIDSDVARCSGDKSYTDWTYLSAGECDMSWDAAITPIVIDLDRDGIETVSRANSGGSFDLFGNGHAIESGWVGADDGMLAIDLNGNGRIDDISELFGGNTKGDGFAKLAQFDSNGDGVVNADDADFAKLSIWQDANGNHQTDAGELRSLADAGVASLKVGYEELPFLDAQGNLHLERSSATMSDGTSVDMTDVYFNVSRADADAAGVNLSSMSDLLDMGGSLDTLLGSAQPVTTVDGMAVSAGAATESANDFAFHDIATMKHLADLYDQAVCA